jgi:hypothetical protein
VKRVLWVLLLSCGPVDVIVADVPKACATSADCHPEDFCDKAQCTDDTGQCRPRPMSCPGGSMLPECACNGTTYASGCEREQAGQSRGIDCTLP